MTTEMITTMITLNVPVTICIEGADGRLCSGECFQLNLNAVACYRYTEDHEEGLKYDAEAGIVFRDPKCIEEFGGVTPPKEG